jgi:hypothetical protein
VRGVLPSRDIPEHKHTPPPPEVLSARRAETIRRLKESGRMKRIREQASRQPSAVRFTL